MVIYKAQCGNVDKVLRLQRRSHDVLAVSDPEKGKTQ